MELRYSPDQPRDDHGRFGDASGSGDKYNPNSKELKKEIRILKSGISAGTAEKINEAAKAGDGSHPIINAIRHETTQGQDVYRGVKAKADDPITKAAVGDSVQILPSSFSLDQGVAERFAVPLMETDPVTHDFTGSYQPVVLHVEGESNGIVLGDRETRFRAEKEVISGGHYQVTARSVEKGVIRLGVKQTGVF